MIRQSRITSDCGWLAPDGGWYPCEPEGHEWLPPGDRDRLTRALEELVAELYSRGDTERSREP